MRTIIDIPDGQLAALDGWCAREGVSRAEGVRRSVAAYVGSRPHAAATQAFGLWRGRQVEGLAYQRELRKEWDPEPRRPRKARR